MYLIDRKLERDFNIVLRYVLLLYALWVVFMEFENWGQRLKCPNFINTTYKADMQEWFVFYD